MLVSVLMPVFNAEKYLSTSLESILSQTFNDFELLIIDDGSTDSSAKVISKYEQEDKRVKLVKLENHKNISVALNSGLEVASGKYIVRMDADDWAYPDRIEKQVNFMEKNPEIVVSGGTIEVCDSNLHTLNNRSYSATDTEIRKKIFRFSPFAHPATIWRADVMKEVGGYNVNLEVAQDYDLYFRVGTHGKFGNLRDTLIKLRTHPQSSSMSKGRRQETVTISTRYKAVSEYGYKMSIVDKLYTFAQAASMLIIPPRLKFWLFNLLRSR